MKRFSQYQTLFVWMSVLACAVVGMALVAYATSSGPGVGGDATIYVTTARSLLAGKGLVYPEPDGTSRLLPYSPPFYPLALSGVGLLGVEMVEGARWLNILLFGVTILLCGLYVYRATRRVLLPGIVAGLVAASPVLIGVEAWIMSEGLFLLLGFAGLFVLLDFFDAPSQKKLVAAAILAGLAFLTRYIGLAFVISGGLALLLFARPEERRGSSVLGPAALRRALLYGLIAVLPTLAWSLFDLIATGSVGSRSGQPAEAYWQRFLAFGPAVDKILLTWLLPPAKSQLLPEWLRPLLWQALLVVMVAFAGLVVRRLWRAKDGVTEAKTVSETAPAVRLAALLTFFVAAYMAILAGVQVVVYPPVTLASRMLSPVHLAVLVLLFVVLHLALRVLFRDSRWVTLAVLFVGAALLGSYGLRAMQDARGYRGYGMGYHNQDWADKGIYDAIRALPEDTPLISNETTAIMYYTGRAAYPILEIFQDQPDETFSRYGSGNDEAQIAFRERGGALVLFYVMFYNDFSRYGDRLGERVDALVRGLRPVYQGEEGAIYFYP